MSEFSVIYSPPAYGPIIPQRECEHDPAGHRMDLGVHLAPVNRKRPSGRHQVVIEGQLCMKCGWAWHESTETNPREPAVAASTEWWAVYQTARDEFGDKCWQFAVRLSQLAEEVGHLSRLLGLPQCRSQAIAKNQMQITRHHSLRRRLTPSKSASLKFRQPRVSYERWPALYRKRRAADQRELGW